MANKNKKGGKSILAALTGVVVGAGAVLGGVVAMKEKSNIKEILNGFTGKKSTSKK